MKFPSVFPNSYNQDKDDNIDIKEEDDYSEKKKNLGKSKTKVKKRGKSKNKKVENEKSSKSNSKNKDNSNNKIDNIKKTEIKKRGRKPKSNCLTNSEKKNEEKEKIKKLIKEEEEKHIQERMKKKENKEDKTTEDNNNQNLPKKENEQLNKKEEKNSEIIKEKESKIIEEYIGPVQREIKKKLDPATQLALNTNNLLNLLSNNPEKITKENINSLLALHNTVQEKTNYFFDVIISNLIIIELSRILTLFEVFLDINQDSKTIIGINILENIDLHLNASSLLSNKIHLKVSNKSNETYKTYITENFSSPIFIISFLIDILYRKLDDISCLSHFIYQLVFDKNLGDKNKSKILFVLNNTRKEKIIDIKNKLFYKEEQFNRYSSIENENKFYFFLSYKNTLVSENIIDFILTLYSKETQTNNKDDEIISKFNKILESIPPEEELKIIIPTFPEVYKSSVKFNKYMFFIEIFQALYIIVEVKDIKWIADKIFSNILWKVFQSSKKDSLKRALSIYYTSLLFYLCLKNGMKNKTNENLLEQQEFSRIYGWLYSLYNPQQQFENLISFYERLCAMSWIVESPIMTMSTKVVESIKEVANNIIIGEKEPLCPNDFMDKLKKIKL